MSFHGSLRSEILCFLDIYEFRLIITNAYEINEERKSSS